MRAAENRCKTVSCHEEEKMLNLKFTIPIFLILIFACSFDKSNGGKIKGEKEKSVLLIGVTHFNQFGTYGLKPLDILNEENQVALKKIGKSVKKINPSKIYVEWEQDFQQQLDSIYHQYLKNGDVNNADFFKSEFCQLAFRIGKLAEIKSISAIDRGKSLFPIDSILMTLDSISKEELNAEISKYQTEITNKINNQIENGENILSILTEINSEESRKKDLNSSHSLLKYGSIGNEIGIKTLTNWHEKHLAIWSRIQKETKDIPNPNIVIIFGMSHIAILEKIIEMDGEWKIENLETII